MPTYIYETIDEPHIQFEIRQSMKDSPLTRHPETGVPVRRVILGGYGLIQKAAAPKVAPRSSQPRGCCGGACGHAH